MLEQNWQLMIDEIWNTRQVNDYTGKNINKKDFMRSWTHSRTAQHISFDELLEEGTTVDGELLFVLFCLGITGKQSQDRIIILRN